MSFQHYPLEDVATEAATNVFSMFTGKHLCCKKRLQHRYFLVNIAIFFRTSILKNICKRLFLWRLLNLPRSSILVTDSFVME